MDGTLDPMVEEPSKQAYRKQVDQGQQEVDGFFSELSDMQVAEELEKGKVNEV